MGNIALGKSATASDFVAPYSGARAFDGSLAPLRRWLCHSVPSWLSVDLGANYWVDRCTIYHLPHAGWPANYVLGSFKIQGSLDSVNWFTLHTVSNNSSPTTDITFNATEVRYVRLLVTSGLIPNQQMATILEMAVMEAPPTSSKLSSLSSNLGDFIATTGDYDYVLTTAHANSSICVIPIAEDPNATIEVNGEEVPSGQESQAISLNVGDNPITIEVTAAVGGGKTTYTANVVREEAPDTSLSGLSTSAGSLNPTFSSTTLNYTVGVGMFTSSATVTPTAADPSNVTIKVGPNEEVVASGSTSQAISVPAEIEIKVISNIDSSSTVYKINVQRT